MSSLPSLAAAAATLPEDMDHIVFLHDVSWEDYESLLRMRGDHSAPRINYLEGEVEIMSPSFTHERIKSMLGCLIETYCLERGIRFQPAGSWTLKEHAKRRGAEADECYIFGAGEAERPHLAIEVIWTSGRIDKLDIYRKLGVEEVWMWREGRLTPYRLQGERYVPMTLSRLLPGLDLDLLVGLLERPTAYDANLELRAVLAREDGGRQSDA
jgi:Uma2 family endonuclease